ncbi:MAG: hypothetical protein FWB86_06345 [Treponema sp.]|nr:hypothetical protein [Treponema sp.]MCL2251867.1 hypothetical protein [Treponema sp.]
MNDIDSFVKILKYQNTSKVLQLENYTTELFVFVLNYLKYCKSIILVWILNLFKIKIKDDFKNLNITTQQNFCVGDNECILDILIEYKGKKTVIEVKIDSRLNSYSYNGKEINQIDYYKNIKGINAVYLLSKRIISIKNPEYRIIWSRISDLVGGTNDFILKNFYRHLEENDMASYKLAKRHINSISSALRSINIIEKLLIDNWPYDIYNYSVKPINVSLKNGWVGSYIYNDKKEQLFWVGIINDDSQYIYIQLLNSKLKKKLGEKKYGNIEGCFDRLDIENIAALDNSEDQRDAIYNWYIKVMNKLERLLVKK